MNTGSEAPQKKRNAVFILGIHRSTTSAVTLAVKALGFDLGDNLKTAKPDNIMGSCEDRDAFKLNERVFESDVLNWDRLSLLDKNALTIEEREHFVCQATELLRRKFEGVDRFAIKPSPISLFLPIWDKACANLCIVPAHILCLRHPSFIASSMASRNAIPLNVAMCLWLNHIYAILRDCRSPLLVVGHENLLSNPRHELIRLAQFLNVGDDFDCEQKPTVSELIRDMLAKDPDNSRIDHHELSGDGSGRGFLSSPITAPRFRTAHT